MACTHSISDEIMQVFLNIIHSPFFSVEKTPRKVEEWKLFYQEEKENVLIKSKFSSDIFPKIENLKLESTMVYYFSPISLIQLCFANPTFMENMKNLIPKKSPNNNIKEFMETKRCRTNSYLSLNLIKLIKSKIGIQKTISFFSFNLITLRF